MIKLPDDIVVLDYTYEEIRRFKPPVELELGESKLHYFLPEEYRHWCIYTSIHDYQRDRVIVILSEKPIQVQSDVIMSDEGHASIIESIINFL